MAVGRTRRELKSRKRYEVRLAKGTVLLGTPGRVLDIF